MSKSYFISDLHLASDKEARYVIFLSWLKSLKGCLDIDNLFLVGDIFDLWIADRKIFIKEFQSIIDEFQRLKKEGVEIHYFEGNHDLYLKKYWQKTLGFKVYTSGNSFKLNSFKIYVEHGDQMDPEDKAYLFLRWFLRTSVMRYFAFYAPEFLISWIGLKAKDKSRYYTSKVKTINKERAKSVIRKHVQKLRKKQIFDIHISGHMHICDDFNFIYNKQKVRLFNLGTWLVQPGYFYIDSEKQEFVKLKAR